MISKIIKALISSIALLFSFIVNSQTNSDWHTLSNYQQIISQHVELNLAVDFDKKQLDGFIIHQLKYLDDNAKQIMLDTRDLDIHKVEYFAKGKWHKTTFILSSRDKIRGSKLTIDLAQKAEKIKIYYNSRPEASGLQWLTPIQTAGKVHPFMFSQSQAIHARSWMPIQDTPAMRVSYSATIKTDPKLRPIMSAKNDPKWHKDGIYQFEMPQPIPPYLIAIAAGNIQYKPMSKQTAVYAEPEILDAAASEFEDTQAMINAAEKLYGKYRWTDYDLLILPPSFPFGGMENPRLSFITPTVIAGDKSLVSLIAHELAHSWSGNLVTNATWRDLWLNEGFTSYVENRIMEVVYGKKRAVMEQALAVQDLNKEIVGLDKKDTILYVEMANRDPDDAFSGIPYTKGQLFLMFLEQRFGRANFDTFLHAYFEDHAFQSIDTKGFVAYLNSHLINKFPSKVTKKEINEWIYQPLLPANAPQPTSNAFTIVQQEMDSWLAEKMPLDQLSSAKWTVHEWLYFINNLPTDINLKHLNQLDNYFKLTASTNNEIAHAWLLLNIKRNNPAIEKRLRKYMVSIGRRKLIVPLYKALLDNPSKRKMATSIFKEARPGYHPLAQGTIDALFNKGL